jgi:hypothetical protein
MPIKYDIDRPRGIIIETWWGKITKETVAHHWEKCLSDPEVLDCRRTLADLRQTEIAFTGPELEQLVKAVAIPKLTGKKWKTAILVSNSLQFGSSRQYQVFAESFSKDSIFYDETAAILWLNQPD